MLRVLGHSPSTFGTASMTPRRRLLLSAASAFTLAVALAAAPVHAQAWPTKTVSIIVSFPPGGDTDALARVFAEKLTQRIGTQFIVENRTGASGTIGNAAVARAAPDGHTILFTPNTITTATMVLKPGTGQTYDVLNDFAPIIQVGSQSLFLVVNASTGVNNMSEFLAAARSGKVTQYASPGSGSPMHILGELVNKSAGIKLQQVPYRGSGPAVNDLVGGHVPSMYTTLGPVAPHIASGKLRNIAVADLKRSPLAPDVPTLAESGVRDAEVGAWQGFMAPKGTPPAVIATLNAQVNEILKMPDVLERMKVLALIPVGGTPDVLRSRLATDYERYAKVIKEFGIQAD
jgi:tripartite-type tricarboxylate transporter receptor subunit TctC